MLKTITFHAEKPGPRLLVLGAVHGNEPCGTIAIHRFIAELERGLHKVQCGRVTLLPICNPRAYEHKVRYVERNLNRNLLPQEVPDCYEAVLGNLLCPLLRDCDVLLDIHSYHHVTGPAYVFIDPTTAETLAYAGALGVDIALSNFAGAYAADGKEDPHGPNWAIGTTEYAQMNGAMSVTLECGQHDDPRAPEIAYRAILGSLAYLQMIEPLASYDAPRPVRHIRVERVFYRDAGGHFSRDWHDLDTIKEGELIATHADGSEVRAERDCVMIIPYPTAQPGAEWFYLGQTITP